MMHPPLAETDLCRLLAALEEERDFLFLETTRATAEDRRSLLFRRPVTRLRCTAADGLDRFFEQAEEWLAAGFYLAGWFAYEMGLLLEPVLAGRLRSAPGAVLADCGVYREPHIYDHASGSFTGAGPWPGKDGALPAAPGFQISGLRPNQARDDYLQAVSRIKRYIECGDTYQVNYTLKLLFAFEGAPAAFYAALRRNQSVSYGAYLRSGERRILSFSPELFFRKSDRRCLVRPMKGTAGKGRTAAEDRQAAAFLHGDAKNRSENVMIVDLLRNDLGRLCTMGSVAAVSLFDVESYETLHQMTSTVTGDLRPDLSLLQLFRALFPCGSVTGAPKIRTMEIIHELERAERGVYTGGIGFLSPGGEAVFNVPIRTVVLEGSRGELGVGSGIVYDSDPEAEWEECMLKGRFLTHPTPAFELIETMVWLPGEGFWLLDLHLERLAESAAYFGFVAERRLISEHLDRLAGEFPAEPQRVRLTLAKDGRIETSCTPCPPPARVFPPPQTGSGLPRLLLSDQPTDSSWRFLYHKTTRRKLYDRERERALRAGCCEVIFCNERGEVTEGSISNLFVRQGECLVTPPVACGLLNGVFRQHLLRSAPLPVEERPLRPADLAAAAALFIGNSVRGLTAVRL